MGSWRWAPPLAVAAAIGAFALRLFSSSAALPPCLFRALTGVPCPSCGGTHCILALASLDIPRALACNPLLVLLAAGLVAGTLLHAGERLLHRPLLSPEPLLRRPALVRKLAAVLILANWAYLIVAARRP